MMKVRILTCLSLLLFAAGLFAADPSLPELFKRAKDKIRRGRLQRLARRLRAARRHQRRTGFENDRAKLLPVVTFYRGANLAALGRKVEAKEAFAAYLDSFRPPRSPRRRSRKRPSISSKQARKEAVAGRRRWAALRRVRPAGRLVAVADEHWIESPVRYLLTPAQKKEYATFTSNAERATFVDAFWKQLDPTPATDQTSFAVSSSGASPSPTRFDHGQVPGRFPIARRCSPSSAPQPTPRCERRHVRRRDGRDPRRRQLRPHQAYIRQLANSTGGTASQARSKKTISIRSTTAATASRGSTGRTASRNRSLSRKSASTS